jgi:hypothetical protein
MRGFALRGFALRGFARAADRVRRVARPEVLR